MTTLSFALLACATCYGAKDAPMTQGMNFAILTLLGVTGLVLGGFAAFLITLARRARRYARESGEGNERFPAVEPRST